MANYSGQRLKPKQMDRKAVVHGRLSFAHLWEPHALDPKSTPKYQTVLLIPKDDEATYNALQAAVNAAKEDGRSRLWNNRIPSRLDIGLRDGDQKADDAAAEGKDMEGFRGYWFINAKAGKPVPVNDVTNSPITDHDKVYSGAWAYISVSAFAYSNSGNNGVSFGLNAVMKTYDDTRLGGDGGGAADFEGMEIPQDAMIPVESAGEDDL